MKRNGKGSFHRKDYGDKRKRYDKQDHKRNKPKEAKEPVDANQTYRISYELLVSIILTSVEKTVALIDFINSKTSFAGVKICVLIDNQNTAAFKNLQEKYSYFKNVILIKVNPQNGLHNHNKSFFSNLGSGYFLMMDDKVSLRDFTIEKSVKFFYDKNEIAAVTPKFYDSSLQTLKWCRRFPNLFSAFFAKILPQSLLNGAFKTKVLEATMEEKGDRAYNIIHRVDHAPSRFLLVKSQSFYPIKGFREDLGADDLYEIDLAKKILKNQQKILFYPFARVVVEDSAFKYSSASTLSQKLKYFAFNRIEIW